MPHLSTANSEAERLVFSLGFVSAAESLAIDGGEKDNAVVNYFTGDDPEEWHTGILTSREVIYSDIYPNIDLRLYDKEGNLKYEFVVKREANLDDIALAYGGVDGGAESFDAPK
jgi:hypothetical protein